MRTDWWWETYPGARHLLSFEGNLEGGTHPLSYQQTMVQAAGVVGLLGVVGLRAKI